MKDRIPQMDMDALRRPEFRHRETRDILGVTDNVLQLWNKRGFVPSRIQQPEGQKTDRGNGRWYSIADIVYLRLFQLLIPYLGQGYAAIVAANCVGAVVGARQLMWFAEEDDEISQLDPGAYLVIVSKDGRYRAELVAPTKQDPGLEEWSRTRGPDVAEVAVVINMFRVARSLFNRIAEQKEKRKGIA